MDAWLYETCTQCLQHMVDIIALFYTPVAPILPRIFDLLSNFVRSVACPDPLNALRTKGLVTCTIMENVICVKAQAKRASPG